ncbi:MAG: prolipoprotein diacylglyceryl transferase family protein [Patescibacteria group bacterium]
MHPVLFELGPLTVYSYGLFVVLAVVVAVAAIYLLARQARLPVKYLADYVLYGTLAALVGARIWYLMLRPDEIGGPATWFAIGGGRLALAGGLLLGSLVLFLLIRRHRGPLWRWLDVVAVGAVLGLAIGRLGSYLNGDYLGTATGLPWGVTYEERPALAAAGERLHPLALYAAGLYAGIAFYAYRLWRLRPAHAPAGMLFWLVLLLVSTVQLALEPWHHPADALFLTEGARATVPVFLASSGVSLWVLMTRYGLRPPRRRERVRR